MPIDSQTEPEAHPDALRILLFGLPAAGKSSLLGALAQAAQVQEHLLAGRLIDRTKGLTELQSRLYEGNPCQTVEEVKPYPASFEPFAETRESWDVELIDCDGRAANELLARRRQLHDAASSLAGEILEADALILPLDVSASSAQVEADFTEFGRFVKLLEQNRGQRTDIGGLPVFLVLTKCDLLAQPGDTPAKWLERIEEHKQRLERKFEEFLARQGSNGPLPFGRINLHPAATAIKRPELAGSPGRPREPHGVAELFRQAIDQARVFRNRRHAAHRRLIGTVAAAGGLLAVLAILASIFLFSGPGDRHTSLEPKVENYRSREGQTPSVRLREPLQLKIGELADLKNDPEFSKLSPELQKYVVEHLQELRDYQVYKEKVEKLEAAESARGVQHLDDMDKAARGIEVPAGQKQAWSQTEAALLQARRLAEIKQVRDTATDLKKWYQDLQQQAEKLRRQAEPKKGAAVDWPKWREQVKQLLTRGASFPELPGVPESILDTAMRMETVERARQAWEEDRQQLMKLRDKGS